MWVIKGKKSKKSWRDNNKNKTEKHWHKNVLLTDKSKGRGT